MHNEVEPPQGHRRRAAGRVGQVGEPVDLFAAGELIAKADVVVIDAGFGIRDTEIREREKEAERLKTRMKELGPVRLHEVQGGCSGSSE